MHQTFRRINVVILLSIGISQIGIFAQFHEHNDHPHEQNQRKHAHPNNEFGIGNYLAYLAGEQEFAYSLHVHYLRSFEESRLGAGIGYEQIFDEHMHRSLTFIGAFRPVSPLVLSLGPGILFGTEENPGIRFTLHAEVVYEFEISYFHLGPAVEIATTFDEYHLGVGLHMAYAF